MVFILFLTVLKHSSLVLLKCSYKIITGLNGNAGMKGDDGEPGQVLLGRTGLPGRPGEYGLVGPRGTPGQKVNYCLMF